MSIDYTAYAFYGVEAILPPTHDSNMMEWYEIDVALEGLDWNRDDRVDAFMAKFGGEREGSGSDGRTRDLIYSFATEPEAKRARAAFTLNRLSASVVELGPVRVIEVHS